MISAVNSLCEKKMIKVFGILDAIDVLAQFITNVFIGPIYHFCRLVTRIHAVIENQLCKSIRFKQFVY